MQLDLKDRDTPFACVPAFAAAVGWPAPCNQCENAFHCTMTKLRAALRRAFSGAFEMPVSRFEIVMAYPSPRVDLDDAGSPSSRVQYLAFSTV